jgi:hypothetical protein
MEEHNKGLIVCMAALAVFLALPQPGLGDTTWDGGGSTDSWGEAANWNGDDVGIPPSNLAGGRVLLTVDGAATQVDIDMTPGGQNWGATNITAAKSRPGQTHTVTSSGHLYCDGDINMAGASTLIQQAGSQVTSTNHSYASHGFRWVIGGAEGNPAVLTAGNYFNSSAGGSQIVVEDFSVVNAGTFISGAGSDNQVSISGSNTVVNVDSWMLSYSSATDAFVVNDGDINAMGLLASRSGVLSILGGDVDLGHPTVSGEVRVQADAATEAQNPTVHIAGGDVDCTGGVELMKAGTLRISGGDSHTFANSLRFLSTDENPGDMTFHVDGSATGSISFGGNLQIHGGVGANELRFTLDEGGVTPTVFGNTNDDLANFILAVDGACTLPSVPLLSIANFYDTQFSNGPEGALYSLGRSYRLTYDLNGDTIQGDIGLVATSVIIPEPASLALVGLGMLGLSLRKRS